MSLKFYAAIVTATITAIFVFDVLWVFTGINIEHVTALSMFAALAAGIAFFMFAYKEDAGMDEDTSRFCTCDNGLNVLIQKSRGRKK